MQNVEKHPWKAGGLVIRADVIARVDEEAKAAYARNEESCGLLIGPENDVLVVDDIMPMVNRAKALHALDPETYPRPATMYFDIDPLKFERAVREQGRAGKPVKVLYHSHVDAGAYFSPTDAEAATAGGNEPTYDLAYLVTSVCKGEVRDRKLFVWSAERREFVETDHRVV
ncbi:MAG: Mov34/MPN/PAD-1 family protein [Polyangiaceae bacterium]|nr:Mov34/MPN/PAD-1 family protein [Polyangiaceae bacterium]